MKSKESISVNAFEQIKSLTMISKIEAIVHLFKSKFPESFADLQPWLENNETKQFNDPNSIDIGFHFHDSNFPCQCGSILMQVKIHRNFNREAYKALEVELSGYEGLQEQWQFSTIECWEFSGLSKPKSEAQELLKQVCYQILQLFNNSQSRF